MICLYIGVCTALGESSEKISRFLNDYFAENCFAELFLCYDDYKLFPRKLDAFIIEKKAFSDQELAKLTDELSDKIMTVEPPVTADKLKAALDERFFKAKSPKSNIFHFVTEREKRFIKLDKIVYIQNKNRVSKVFLANGKLYRFKENILSVYKRLKKISNDKFIMPRNDFILNMDYIKKQESDCFILESMDIIPIKRYNRESILNSFYEYRYNKFKFN